MGCRPRARSVLHCHCVLALRHRSDKPIDILNIGNGLKMAKAFSRYMLSVPNLIWLWRTARCFVACSPTLANFSNPQFGIGIDVVPCFFFRWFLLSYLIGTASNWGPRSKALVQWRLGELVLIKKILKTYPKSSVEPSISHRIHRSFGSALSISWAESAQTEHLLNQCLRSTPQEPSAKHSRKTPFSAVGQIPHFSGHQAALLSCPTIRRAART